jgi:hypothetical protein
MCGLSVCLMSEISMTLDSSVVSGSLEDDPFDFMNLVVTRINNPGRTSASPAASID